MATKSLLYGLTGFFIGGLVVSVAATTMPDSPTQSEATMSQMTDSLRDKKGDEYDKAFIAHMIDHHRAAVDVAKLSAERAQHDELRQLSLDIVSTQNKEIEQMKSWQKTWGYDASNSDGDDSHMAH